LTRADERQQVANRSEPSSVVGFRDGIARGVNVLAVVMVENGWHGSP
jgi:hypothetical protein